MKVKITRPDGTTIEAEGTVEECERLVGPAPFVLSPYVFRIQETFKIFPSVPVEPWVPPPYPGYGTFKFYPTTIPVEQWYLDYPCRWTVGVGTGVGTFTITEPVQQMM